MIKDIFDEDNLQNCLKINEKKLNPEDIDKLIPLDTRAIIINISILLIIFSRYILHKCARIFRYDSQLIFLGILIPIYDLVSLNIWRGDAEYRWGERLIKKNT